MKVIERNGAKSGALIAAALLVACSLLALTNPYIPYDSWWYHLPFSSRLWNIGGGVSTFHLSPMLVERWLGFPKAWEWIQGLAWAVTGTLYAIIVPQLLLCGAYFAYVSRTHHVPLNWVILAFFASPMLFLHFQATYLDLPAAICVALGFFLLFDLLEHVRASGQQFPWLLAFAAIASLGLAGNIKYQSLFACYCVTAIVAAACIVNGGIPTKRRVALVAVLVIADAVASASAVSNLSTFRNPFYPLEISLHDAAIFNGPEAPEAGARYPTYKFFGPRLISFPGPVNFLLSATELDWTVRGVPPWYNVDSNTGDVARRGAPARTGGWGGLFVIMNACLLGLQLLGFRREPDRHQRLLVISTLVLIAATSCLPRAHELRYWLYIPLVLIAVNLRYLQLHYRNVTVSTVLVILTTYGGVQIALSPPSGLFTRHPTSAAALRATMRPAVVEALQETGRYCDSTDDQLFRYSSAVTGLRGLVSSVAADCHETGP